MKTQRPKRDLVEIFGYAPDDMSTACRSLWTLGACPFTEAPCVKTNHDKTVVYGVCSVTTKYGDCVVCPNRLYADGKAVLKRVAQDAFGSLPFYSYQEFVRRRAVAERVVSGPNLPTSEDLDGAVARALGVEKALTSGDNA